MAKSTHFKVIFDRGEINKIFFIYATNHALKEAFKKAHGFKATMEHIKRRDFEDSIVMIPDLIEQKRFSTFVHQSDKSKFAALRCLKHRLPIRFQDLETIRYLIDLSG